MTLTRRGWIVLTLTAVLLGVTAQLWNPYTRALTAAAATPEAAPATYYVDAYEDGSGVVYENHKGAVPQEIATLPEYLLPWDCTGNGNGECGPKPWEPGVYDHTACVQFVVERIDTTIKWCTDGLTDWWPATDTDAEGEVV